MKSGHLHGDKIQQLIDEEDEMTLYYASASVGTAKSLKVILLPSGIKEVRFYGESGSQEPACINFSGEQQIMPWYTKLPTELQAILEKKTGAKPRVKVIYDPDGYAVELSGRYDIVSVTPISNERELDIAYSDQTMIQGITMVF